MLSWSKNWVLGMSQNLNNTLPPRSSTSSDSSGGHVEGSPASLENVAELPPPMSGFELAGGSPLRLLEGVDPEEIIVVDAGSQATGDQQLEMPHIAALRSEDLPQDLPSENHPQDLPTGHHPQDLPSENHPQGSHVFVDYSQECPGAEIVPAATLPFAYVPTPYDPAGMEPPLRIEMTYDPNDDRKLPATTRKPRSGSRNRESKSNQFTTSPIRVKKPRVTKKSKATKHKQIVESKGSSSSSGQSTSEHETYKPSERELDDAANARAKEALKTWYARFQELVKYKRKNGNTKVPQKYASNPPLGVWVNKQRMEKSALDEGRKSSMTPRKSELLEQIGFQWAKKKGREAWDRKYSSLKGYKEAHGDCNVPTKYTVERSLGRWVSTQRSMYKAYQNRQEQSLAEDEIRRRIALLDEIGFTWTMVPSVQEEEIPETEDGEEGDDEEEVLDPWEARKET